MKVLFTSLLVATGVQAFDMPKLMAHLADPAEGVRVLSELPSGSCLTDILDLSFDYSQLKDGSSVLTDSTPLIFEGVDGAGTLDLWISIDPGETYVPANPDLNGFACAEPQIGDPG